jgi:FemAB-related protein (PEP-CTERM system-associated)
VEQCGDDSAVDWDAFVKSHPESSFYHLFGWRRINGHVFDHQTRYLAAREAGVIRGVLPLVNVKSILFGNILCSMPFLNFGGPLAVDDATARQLVQAAMDCAREINADYLELRSATSIPVDLPTSLQKVSLRIELTSDPDALWNAFTSKHRNNVRRAYKYGLEVEKGGTNLLPDFYRLMEESWHMLGTPLYSRAFFAAILDEFSDATSVFVCRHKGTPVAAALNGYHNGLVEGMWAGGARAARDLDANYVLYWEMIRDACQRGLGGFHLGRSSIDSGGEVFKKRWNADTKQLYWVFHRPRGGPLPGLNVSNPRYRWAIRAWQQLPLWIVRRLGPAIAPYIP